MISDPKLKLNSLTAMDPFIGQLMCVGFNFAPNGWAVCDGSLLSISQNSALFSLLGTAYGGNGTTTFGLPDLRGRVPVGMGTGPGLPNVAQGEVFGSSTTTILVSNLPAHAHGIPPAQVSGAACISGPATTNNPAGAYPASVEIAVNDGGNGATATALAYATGTPTGTLAGGASIPASSTGITGGSQPIDNQPPSLGMNWIIATQGIYPSRQ
jgi:microcystin-dependent protein